MAAPAHKDLKLERPNPARSQLGVFSYTSAHSGSHSNYFEAHLFFIITTVIAMSSESEADTPSVAKPEAKLSTNTPSVAKPEDNLSTTSSVQKPATNLSPLAHLTKNSARFLVCEVLVYHPTARSRKYMYQSQERTAHHFQCLLVSTKDPCQYMLGDAHGTGMTQTKLKQLTDRFKQGLVFHMSKIQFASNVNRQYNSAPKSEVISMLNTTWSPVLVSVEKPNMPEPAIPIVKSMDIEQEQAFDALALVQKVSEALPGGKTPTGQQRMRCQVVLNDGSKHDETGKVCHLPVTIFADANVNGDEPMLFQQLRNSAQSKTAWAFFGIQGKKSTREFGDPAGWSFQSSFDFFCAEANNTKKGKELQDTADELDKAEAETIPQSVLQSRNGEQTEKFENEPAVETTCALLNSMLVDTKIEAIESETTFWQINWCRVHLPDKDANIANNDNSRLWMLVAVEDETGHVKVFMREQAALSLAGADTKQEFESLRADDVLEFPAKASIKIIRKPAESLTNSADKPARIHCYIVEAKEQDIAEPPSASSLMLFNLLEKTEGSTSVILPASLSMIKKDLHYGLSVSYTIGSCAFKKRAQEPLSLLPHTSPPFRKP